MGNEAVLAVSIKNISFRYKKASRQALDGVTLDVGSGEIFGLLGPNGGGKTTLFKILSTHMTFDSGSVRIAGMDLSSEASNIRKKIGVIFQHPSLDKKLTIQENLTHQGRLYGMGGAMLKERIREVLGKVGLTDRAGEFVETLSGGLARRAEIAKGLLHKPEIVLMDEPTTGLDPGARRDFWDYVKEIKSSGVTVLVTTHLMEEAERCDRLAIINEGRIVALNTPSALKDEIGGDVIMVETQDPQTLSDSLNKKYGSISTVLEGSVRIERDRGHEFVPVIVQDFPKGIVSIRVSKPTLEDVFVHRTGHKFWSEKS